MKPPGLARLMPESMKILEKIHGYPSLNAALAANPEIKPADVNKAMEDLKQNLPELLGAADNRITRERKSKSKKLGKAKRDSDAYQIKITLAHSKPPIWRRVVVPAEINLEELSNVIQAVMGWGGGHLHGFEIRGEPYDGLCPDGSEPDERMGLAAWKCTLCEEVPAPKMKFRYEYDFGDGWSHQLLVEKIFPAAEKSVLFTCTGGKGRCPPDDCGGIWGYYQMLETLSKPDDPEHASVLEWCGGPIDPNEFDLAAANDALAHLRK